MQRRTLIQSSAALLSAGLLGGLPALAQDFPPKKPVTMVVGFAAGGAADRGSQVGQRLGGRRHRAYFAPLFRARRTFSVMSTRATPKPARPGRIMNRAWFWQANTSSCRKAYAAVSRKK